MPGYPITPVTLSLANQLPTVTENLAERYESDVNLLIQLPKEA